MSNDFDHLLDLVIAGDPLDHYVDAAEWLARATSAWRRSDLAVARLCAKLAELHIELGGRLARFPDGR